VWAIEANEADLELMLERAEHLPRDGEHSVQQTRRALQDLIDALIADALGRYA
jgi:hypothetical protein